MATSDVWTNDVHFGTDGWRAVIDEGFNLQTLARVAEATAQAYLLLAAGKIGDAGAGGSTGAGSAGVGSTADTASSGTPDVTGESDTGFSPTLYIGYDCRRNAGRYASFVASIVAGFGLNVLVSDRYCPTPALCWTIAQDPRAIGGIMLTASHNPAEYLGVKLRMADGGASPDWFSKRVEGLLSAAEPAGFERAGGVFAAASNATPDQPAGPLPQAGFGYTDLMRPYLENLATVVDREAIARADLSVVLDPMYGAGRGYLCQVLRDLGVQVYELHGESDPDFAGLHPEPILPWVQQGADKVAELGYAACLVNDGDADRIGSIDTTGKYVTSHRLICLLIAHLVEDRGLTGRVVRTSAGSNLLRRQALRLGLELVTRPIGFKYIYEEMLAGNVLIGGEESGGFGIPWHVHERDGLLMALLLVEMMAQRGKHLAELVDEMLAQLGVLEYNRLDLRLLFEQQDAFVNAHVKPGIHDFDFYRQLFVAVNEELIEIDRADGIMLRFASDAWLLARTSGTEPLVRIYAEAANMEQVEALIDVGRAMAEGRI